jgi:hypothetical protein
MKTNEQKSKKYFDVRVECLLPATLYYRVLSETPEEAANLIGQMYPNQVKYRLIGRKNIKLSVYDAGCSIIKFMKNLVGVLR